MQRTFPLVSIIIPTYSRSEFIERAINSVLNQTYKNIEIIIVDDNGEGTEMQINSENKLIEYIKLNNFKYIIHKKNMNGSAARNTGIENAEGVYIGFLDDDDEFLPDKIKLQVEILENQPHYGGAYCNTDYVLLNNFNKKINNNIYYNKLSGNLAQELLLGDVRFATSTLLLRKEVCINLNGFNTSYRRHQDLEFLMRFFQKYEIVLAGKNIPLLKYDGTNHSSHIPKGRFIYDLKIKFLKEFGHYIQTMPRAYDILHHIWLEAVPILFLNKEYKLAKETYRKSVQYRPVSIREKLSIIKYIIKHSLLK